MEGIKMWVEKPKMREMGHFGGQNQYFCLISKYIHKKWSKCLFKKKNFYYTQSRGNRSF